MVIALIKARVNVNAVDKDGRIPLHWAVHKENLEIVNVLIQVRANVNAQDLYERTPLHYAAMSGDIKVVEALLKIKEIDINLADKDGNTPLDLASTEEIKTLLKKAKEKIDDIIESKDNEGNLKEDTDTQQGERQVDDLEEEEESIEETDVQAYAASTPESTETESSFFSNLFSIFMKPFSLIASFFGGFFSWLFGSDTDESTSQTDARCEGESSSCDYDATRNE